VPRHRGLSSKARKWTKIRPDGQPPLPIQSAGRARLSIFVEPERPKKGGAPTQDGTSLTLVCGNEGLWACSADFEFGGRAHGGCGLGRICTEGAEGGGLGGHRGTICPCPSEMNGPHSKVDSKVCVVGEKRSHGADCGPKSAPRQRPDHVNEEAIFTVSTKNAREMKRAAKVWRWACGEMTNESKSCSPRPSVCVFFEHHRPPSGPSTHPLMPSRQQQTVAKRGDDRLARARAFRNPPTGAKRAGKEKKPATSPRAVLKFVESLGLVAPPRVLLGPFRRLNFRCSSFQRPFEAPRGARGTYGRAKTQRFDRSRRCRRLC
jgi:hypothetical protein